MPKQLDFGSWTIDNGDKPKIYNLKSITRKSKGFTLIELLIVISIIGILATFVIASFTGAQARGRDARRKSDLDALKKAFQLYYSDNQTFPTIGSSTTAFCWIDTSSNPCVQSLNSALVPTYIKTLPFDPKNSCQGSVCNQYKYCVIIPSGQTRSDQYYLFAGLENSSDPQMNYNSLPAGILNPGSCGNYVNGSPPAIYWVTNP